MRYFLGLVLIGVITGTALGAGALLVVRQSVPWSLAYERPRTSGDEAPPPEPVPPRPSKARIDPGPIVHDFGIADRSSKGVHVFTIKNIGSEPLLVKVDRKTCSCTDAKLSKSRLAPGESGNLTLWWDGEQATGHFRQGASIETNDPNEREVLYHIEGLFSPAVLASPSELMLSEVRTSEMRSAKVRLYSFEDTPLELSAVRWDDHDHYDWASAATEFTQQDREDPLRKYAKSVIEGIVTVKPGLPIGTFQQTINIETNSRREPRLGLTVGGQIVNDWVSIAGVGYSRDTGVWRLGKTTPGRELKGDCSIHFTGMAATKAAPTVAEVSPPWLRVRVSEPRDIGTRRLFTITVEIPADAPVGSFMQPDTAAIIWLDTGVAELPTLRIPVFLAIER